MSLLSSQAAVMTWFGSLLGFVLVSTCAFMEANMDLCVNVNVVLVVKLTVAWALVGEAESR